MNNFIESLVLILLINFTAFSPGSLVDCLQYDYSASIECLADPLKPQYGGGILKNSEFNESLTGWSSFGYANITTTKSESGNHFTVVTNRTQPDQSVSQKVDLQQGMLYTFSAWLQVSEGKAVVKSVFKTSEGFIHAGAVEASSGCWSMLKGGLSVEKSGTAELYFESENATIEIWVDSVSLQHFTQEEWTSHHTESIHRERMKLIKFRVLDAQGKPLPNATVSIDQIRPGFPLGSAISSNILTDAAYQNWVTSRFTVTTFANEMKWYSTEVVQGREDYTVADKMLAFAKSHRISVRGHNIVWDDPQYQMNWVRSLSTSQLWDATNQRISSVVSRYRGQVIAWDVINENLHYSFFEDRLGKTASPSIYQKANELDPNTLMFLNDYNTLEQPGDGTSTPNMYLRKLKELWSYPWMKAKLAIGLEGHFDTPNIAYMRSALDTLASIRIPIWLTEVDVSNKASNQAQALEQVLREAFSHPAVNGIVIWGALSPNGCYRMCLTDNSFKRNLPTGDVVDKLIGEWKSGSVNGTTDADGFFETQLFHGEYEMRLGHNTAGASPVQSLVMSSDSPQDVILKIKS